MAAIGTSWRAARRARARRAGKGAKSARSGTTTIARLAVAPETLVPWSYANRRKIPWSPKQTAAVALNASPVR
jgi:hypothetical protein